MQELCLWTLCIVLFRYKATFRRQYTFLLQGKRTQFATTHSANPYLRTQIGTSSIEWAQLSALCVQLNWYSS
jgi:hypothetical protein